MKEVYGSDTETGRVEREVYPRAVSPLQTSFDGNKDAKMCRINPSKECWPKMDRFCFGCELDTTTLNEVQSLPPYNRLGGDDGRS